MKKTKNRPTREEFKIRCQTMYDDIANQITDKKLVPGTCLSSEENLGKKYKISRESVRSVIAQMITHGYVTRIKGKGVIVGQTIPESRKLSSSIGIILAESNALDTIKSGNFDPRALQNRHAVILSTLEHKFLDLEMDVKFLTRDSLFKDSQVATVQMLTESFGGLVIVYDFSPEMLEIASAAASKGVGIIFAPMYAPCPPLTSSVTWDNYQVGRMAAEHLVKLGHRNIACMGIEYPFQWVQLRMSGFQDYCTEHSISFSMLKADVPQQTLPTTEIVRSAGSSNAMQLLQKYKATGAFAVNDDLAFGIYEGLTKDGIKVPDDFSIVGCDNDYSLPWNEMTTFNLECIRTAESAADMLIAYLRKENNLIWPIEVKIQPRLIVRNSSASPKS